jgi:hypothetical protein
MSTIKLSAAEIIPRIVAGLSSMEKQKKDGPAPQQ